ncbi:MAG: tail protein X, partial [Alphaproteobacteria bacterium]|nr:tail protein X [Alphaproteobacteria bacterium]
LTQNRHLAKYGAILPAGIKITLPDIIQDTNKNKIKLWQ